MYEVTSPENNDTKISNFGSVVCFLGHILRGNVEFPNFPFQPELDANECHHYFACHSCEQSMRIVHERVSSMRIAHYRIDQVNLITVHNYMASRNGIYSALKRIFFLASTLPHKMCPRKQTTEQKLIILVSFFSGDVTSYTDPSYYIHILREVSSSVFSGPPCIYSTDGQNLVFI